MRFLLKCTSNRGIWHGIFVIQAKTILPIFAQRFINYKVMYYKKKKYRVQHFYIPRLTINERNQWHCSKTFLNSFTSRFDHRLQSRRQMQNRSSQFVRVALFNDDQEHNGSSLSEPLNQAWDGGNAERVSMATMSNFIGTECWWSWLAVRKVQLNKFNSCFEIHAWYSLKIHVT